MQVKEIMTRSVDLVDPNTTIRDAAIKMRDDDVGALPVGENYRLVGMITDRDIAIRAVADNKAPSQTTVRDVMSEGICYCFEDDAVDDAARIMARRQIDHAITKAGAIRRWPNRETTRRISWTDQRTRAAAAPTQDFWGVT